MMRTIRRIRIAVLATATGLAAFQVAGCSGSDVKLQLSNGVRTALNGLFNVSTTAFANQVFDVDN